MPSSGKSQKERAGPCRPALGLGPGLPARVLEVLTTLFSPCRTRRCGDPGGKDALFPTEQKHQRQADLDSHGHSHT